MPILIGRLETEHGQKYLVQLCKHFAHKIEASWSDDHGRVDFVYGPAVMTADPLGLTVRFDVDDLGHVEDAKSVIDRHLARFAHREGIEGLIWTETGPEGADTP
ncbi:DUF2218 domain-containing protein [Paracoccus sp. TK19116]|uniref:DUF2218 domain-containing protein n=1 Tax=Paracoccus albicereus TaxID=2922394 RepID=A0ABT1MMQ4_9RHOB|nr:DUF2218 domain-containing protein [Paracoccus albicereus]MCQ0969557.1 DUF2218 domain-containing protein [Paracoccus albicereus]